MSSPHGCGCISAWCAAVPVSPDSACGGRQDAVDSCPVDCIHWVQKDELAALEWVMQVPPHVFGRRSVHRLEEREGLLEMQK